jgi:hypothetical protein
LIEAGKKLICLAVKLPAPVCSPAGLGPSASTLNQTKLHLLLLTAAAFYGSSFIANKISCRII